MLCAFRKPLPPRSQAASEYEKALKLEPANEQVQLALTRARVAAARQETEGKHRFKRKLSASDKAPASAPAAKQKRAVLSFQEDDEDAG